MVGRADYNTESDLKISEQACDWTVRAMSTLRRRLSINIKTHHKEGQLQDGQIFLFNHFARFETFVTNYVIFKETGNYCRSVATHELFANDNPFGRYLQSLGAVPNNYLRLLPFLAEEILKGRKVVFFPEGGLVKDRRVLDDDGQLNMYSRTSMTRRKHHSGAALLALTLDSFKVGILENYNRNNIAELERWVGKLQLGSVGELLSAVSQPTMVMPSNITFYPMRVGSNSLQRYAELFSGGLNPQLEEELLIEGNLLLKDSDMDIRVGNGIHSAKSFSFLERKMLGIAIRGMDDLDEFFKDTCQRLSWRERLVHACIKNRTDTVREACMREMYSGVTVNLSHLAAGLVLQHLDNEQEEIGRADFHRMLYLAIKNLQTASDVHLHRGLVNPEKYAGVWRTRAPQLAEFISEAENLDLIKLDAGTYKLLPKLRQEHDFESVRLQNPIDVYANEVAPIKAVQTALQDAYHGAAKLSDQDVARLQFDDELRTLEWDRQTFHRARFSAINDQETATDDPSPYLLIPEDGGNGLGVVLVHGFLASPAELKRLGERIAAAGHPVIGVRLKGHGTSPHDLATRDWKEWLDAVQRGCEIISPFAKRVCLVGFSTGGSLSLIMAAQRPEKLAGVAVVSAPLKFRNKNLVFVPLLHGASKLMKYVPATDNRLAFRVNESEHPHINYRNIPTKGIYELRRAVAAMNAVLGDVVCPAVIMQGDSDAVVDPHSADLIYRKIGSTDKQLQMIESDRHGILNEDIGDTQDKVLAFLARIQASHPIEHRRKPMYPWETAYTGIGQWHAPLPAKPLYSIFDESVARFGARPCIEFLKRTYTYAEIARQVDRAVAGLQKLGVVKGTRVGLCLPNTPYSVISYFAVLKAGGIVVNINPLYAAQEIEHLVRDSAMEIAITIDLKQLFSKIAPLIGTNELRKVVVCNFSATLPVIKGALYSVWKSNEISKLPEDERFISFDKLIDNDGKHSLPAIDPESDIAVLQYSGGTTGVPKGAMLTHANLFINTEQIRRMYKDVREGRERMLIVLPLFHVFAMTVGMNYGIATGAQLVLLPRFDIEETLKTIRDAKPTIFPAVPALFSAISTHPGLNKSDLTSIRICISGGAPLPLSTKSDFETLTGCQIVEGYGLSEASPVATCNPIGGIQKPGSVGIPLSRTIVEIRDPENPAKLMPQAEIGEICIDGPQVMAGYWKGEKETADALDGGVLHTGDLGYMDEDGFLFMVDRQKDLILNGGFNVYPRVVEEALQQFPDVVEAAVIGIPHDQQGEVPKAFLVLKAGAAQSADAIHAFLSDKLSPMEMPREIEFRQQLPKTLVGKLSKKELIDEEALRRPQSQVIEDSDIFPDRVPQS
jgi:acyl-CoA synthetase (AMP-forming)/AMP-acid ligase II/esterase/lipase